MKDNTMRRIGLSLLGASFFTGGMFATAALLASANTASQAAAHIGTNSIGAGEMTTSTLGLSPYTILAVFGLAATVALVICGTTVLVGAWVVHEIRNVGWKKVADFFRSAADDTNPAKDAKLLTFGASRGDRTSA